MWGFSKNGGQKLGGEMDDDFLRAVLTCLRLQAHLYYHAYC